MACSIGHQSHKCQSPGGKQSQLTLGKKERNNNSSYLPFSPPLHSFSLFLTLYCGLLHTSAPNGEPQKSTELCVVNITMSYINRHHHNHLDQTTEQQDEQMLRWPTFKCKITKTVLWWWKTHTHTLTHTKGYKEPFLIWQEAKFQGMSFLSSYMHFKTVAAKWIGIYLRYMFISVPSVRTNMSEIWPHRASKVAELESCTKYTCVWRWT